MTRQVVVFALVCGMEVGCGASGADDGEAVEAPEALTARGATAARAAAADTADAPVKKTAATDRAATLDAVAVVAPPTTAPSGATAAGPDLTVSQAGTLSATMGSIAAPAAFGLFATADSVTVTWADNSNNELEFIVYRRDAQGSWQAVHTVPTTNVAGGDYYVWVDTDKSLGAQCYYVAAVNDQLQGGNAEQCTVRPDPANFPQYPPSEVQQWHDLSSKNDTAAPLFNDDANMYLQGEDRTFGVSLGWTETQQNNVKLERRGPSPLPLMRGEPVALRVWGAGWLTHGTQTFGVDLVLSDTPAYEWYVVGGPVGAAFDGGEVALWNKTAGDYLVSGGQDWGIGLNWYQKTFPPATVTPPPPGVKTFVVYNCHSDGRPLEMWVADLTAGTGFSDRGSLDAQWGSSGCPATGQPWTFTPTSGHNYIVRGVDYSASGCANAPDISSCERSETTFTGDANGQVISTTVD